MSSQPVCPRCGAAAAATTTASLPPSQPASQPDDAAAPSTDAVAGGVASCTACGFILDDAPLDGRPPPRYDGDKGGESGPGGANVSGRGDGVFVSAHPGAVGAAGKRRRWRGCRCGESETAWPAAG